MKYLYFILMGVLLVGCAETDVDANENGSSDDSFLTREMQNDFYEDARQIKRIIDTAFKEERQLDHDEQILFDRFDNKYDSSDLTFYEDDVYHYLSMIRIYLNRSVRDDPQLDSEETYADMYLDGLGRIKDILDQAEVVQD
ncbi:hypothetical protein [Salipaludibacillus agaradhaerens]|uniref:hypothetical protein n=1 Tax=Salipaludibacillus agaradhaerens TaxID=76935 RepID=UPI0009976C2D|nr:hypothetical protein [Salipaludibacillus agaradhaerens]